MLHNVFYAIIVSKITYTISTWYSFFVNAQIAQINSLFKRAFKYGYVKFIITVEELLASYDDQLFIKQLMMIIVYIYYRLLSLTNMDHRRLVAQPCVNGDRLSQWRMAKFDPAQIRNPSTDRHKI